MDKEKRITKARLKELGWTESLIRDFAPEPLLKTNPIYKGASPMKLYLESEIMRIMETDEFKEAAKASKKRSEITKAVSTRKKALLVDEYTEIAKRIKIRKKSYEAIEKFAVLEAEDRATRDFGYFCGAPDDKTLHRWAVNYIRHSLTNYEGVLDTLKGKIGRYTAYEEIKRILLEKIARLYPKYAMECENQIKNINNPYWW